MKSIRKILLIIFIIILLIPMLLFTFNALSKSVSKSSNPELKIIKEGWHGNPVNKDGEFVNHEYPFINDITRLIKWQFQRNPQKQEKKNDTFRLKVVDASYFLTDNRDGMIWIGHATFLFRLNGKLFITDPIFTVPSAMMKRFSNLPVIPESLKNIDYILLSHDHYDHLNKESFKLLTQNNPNAKILTGLEMHNLIKSWLNANIVQEAGWYQQYNITSQDVKITFLPARHWSTRALKGFNKRLWGAFMIQTENISIYFGGDSGFGSHFKEVEELFGKPDYSIIGIGAYKPEWFMGSSHTSPADALKAAEQMNTNNFIPMHYGTFDLADEPIGEPYRETHRIYKKEYTNTFNLITPAFGEAIFFD